MNKETYLRGLRVCLANRLPAGETEDILRYYTEYFEDAGEDREQDVIAELGTPEHLARQIVGQRGQETLAVERPKYEYDSDRANIPGGQSGLPQWAGVLILVLAAIFAGPVLAGLVFGLGLAGVLCIVIGIAVAVDGVVSLSLAGALFQAGGGLIAAAVGVLLLLGTVLIVWLAVKFVRWFWNTCVEGRGGHEEVY